MRKLLLIVCSFLLVGCHSIVIPTKYGDAKARSFGQRTKIGDLQLAPDGTLRMKSYNNDQVDGMVELYNAGLAAGKAAAK